MELEFENRIALVTGGAMGIGEAVARLLARQGAKVTIIDRAEEKAAEVAAFIRAEGATAQAIPADVSLAQDAERAIAETLAAFGRLDIVSNNAGIPRYGTVESTPEAMWDEVMNVNIKSVYLVCHYTMPALKRSRGTVVNMASVQAYATQRNVTAYTTSKATSSRAARCATGMARCACLKGQA